MPAYVVVEVTVKNAEKLQEYSAAAGPTVVAHGGVFNLRAAVVETLTGQADFSRFVLIEFPDVQTAQGWYNSPEYQALIPLRDEGADMVFVLTEAL
ncbi:MAG: DUF1330 domain-containing protein [Pseudomonadota bacterium]